MSNSRNLNSILTSDDVRTIVDLVFDDDRTEIIEYHLNPYSKYTVGFMGDHRNLEIVVKRLNSSKPEKLNLFAKILPEESVCQNFLKDRKFFHQEAEFYNKVIPRLLEFYHGEPWGPKCYLANDDIVVLEDVRANGFGMRDKNKIFEGECLKSAARALARMHASSILAERRLGKSLKEIFPDACVEQIFNKDSKDRNMFAVLIELAEKISTDNGRCIRGIALGFEKVYQKLKNLEGKYLVISHTDTWCNNFMLNTDDPPKCLIIDFQLSRYGNRMLDVAQLVYYNTTPEIRKREESDVILAYHEEFNKVIEQHDPSMDLPTISDSRNEFEAARLHGLFATMFYHPFTLVSKEEYLSHEEDPDAKYTKYILRMDNNAVLDLMKRDELYGRRLTDTALELADYCEKLFSEK